MPVTLQPEEAESTASVTSLVSGIVGDVQDLAMQHLALFRNEIKHDLRKTTSAVSSLAAGLAVAQIGGLLICLMAVHLIAQLSPNLSLWVCYGIVGTVVVATGAIAILVGYKTLPSMDTLSSQTTQAIEEDAKWLSKPK
jgi:hypothetical protein